MSEESCIHRKEFLFPLAYELKLINIREGYYKQLMHALFFCAVFVSVTGLRASSDVTRASGSAQELARDLSEKDALKKDIKFRKEAEGPPVAQVEIAGGDKVDFVFKKLTINGLKSVSRNALEQHWKPLIGKRIRLSQVNEILKRIRFDMRKRGFMLAQVILPPQDIDPAKGEVTLEIYEGTLNAIRVEGGTKEARDLVQSQLVDIQLGKSFNMKKLEERMRFIQKTPGYNIRNVFVPSKTTKGATDLVFLIESKKYADVGAHIDNGGNRLTGHRRWGADSVVYNTFRRSKTLFGTIHDYRGSLFHFYRVRQTQFIGNYGTRAYFEYVQSRSEPWLPIKLRSRFDYGNVMLMHPLIYRRNEELKLRLALDGQNDSARIAGLRTKDDYVRAGRLGLLYNQTHANDFWELSVLVNKGITGVIGGTNTIRPSRFGGTANFAYYDGRGLWAHQFNRSVTWVNTMAWQFGGSPLLSSEEMSVGASNFGRGYGGAEITGDKGIGFITEMRFTLPKFTRFIHYMQLYTSYGFGYVKNSKDKIESARNASLASVAAGLRGKVYGGFNVSYEAAKPLTRKVSLRNHRGVHHTFKVSYSYSFESSYQRRSQKEK